MRSQHAEHGSCLLSIGIVMGEKLVFTWSGGKDCAMALYELQRTDRYEVSALLTTVTEDYDRISMHGVRRELLERQAESLGLLLEKILIGKDSSNEDYEARMKDTLARHQNRGVELVAFGDISLQDLRQYREDNLAKLGMKALFPLWNRDTTELAQSFVDAGFKAVVTCVDSNVLDGAFVGREFDGQFLSDLPATVDPCGENGEFHSFVYDGPIFRTPIVYEKGEIVLRDGRFWYCDLIPV
jgi:uncharacterized protein (TIGR00290 family)